MASATAVPTVAERRVIMRGASCVEIRVPIVITGDYTTGGIACDLTALTALFVNFYKVPMEVRLYASGGAAGYKLVWVEGADPTLGKIKVMCETTVATNAPLLEHTAVTLAAGFTGDTTLYGIFRFEGK
jgi:hypothetical protein